MRMSPEFPPELVPVTSWLVIAKPPPVMSVQLEPRLPLALAKLSVTTPTELPAGVDVQVTETPVTLAEPIVPAPLETVQF